MDIEIVERLRAAAREHGEVLVLLTTLESSFPGFVDGDSTFHGDDYEREHLKSAIVAAGFAQYDRKNS